MSKNKSRQRIQEDLELQTQEDDELLITENMDIPNKRNGYCSWGRVQFIRKKYSNQSSPKE